MPVRADLAGSTDDLLTIGEQQLRERGIVESGDTILMLSGHSAAAAATNMLRVHTVA